MDAARVCSSHVWETRDLANARFSETDGWTQSSGHEGNFIGVRRSYAWGAGDYRIRFAPDGDPEDDGVWFGLWITDRSTDVATWIGSLKFPLLDGQGCDEGRRPTLLWKSTDVESGR